MPDLPSNQSSIITAGENMEIQFTETEGRYWDIAFSSLGSGGEAPYENVKDHGAEGDGTTDDTAAIQAAIDAAAAAGGTGHVFFPAGNYLISDTLTLEDHSVRLSGSNAENPDPSPGTWNSSGVRIFGGINGPLIERTTDTGMNVVIIEYLGIHNTHNTGTCVSLNGVEAPSGIYRCWFRGHNGIVATTNIANMAIHDCTFQLGGTTNASSTAIDIPGATHIHAVDINGYETGIRALNDGVIIQGARIEVCGTGIHLGGGGNVTTAVVTGISMEANDVGVYLQQAKSTLVSGVSILGTVGSPSGGSLVGVKTKEVYGCTVASVTESGSHSTGFVQVESDANRADLTLIGVRGASTWVLADRRSVNILACAGAPEILRAPVIATASLPAAAAAEDERLVIEDAGAGDRNLIIYAGGERFRIDGGTAF